MGFMGKKELTHSPHACVLTGSDVTEMMNVKLLGPSTYIEHLLCAWPALGTEDTAVNRMDKALVLQELTLPWGLECQGVMWTRDKTETNRRQPKWP